MSVNYYSGDPYIYCDAPDCTEKIDSNNATNWNRWGSRIDLNLDWCPKHNKEVGYHD